jgi:hypothetical protein
MTLDDREQPLRLLIHDRDSKFSGGCDLVFQSEGIAVIRTPVQAPNANAHAERWVGSVRRECLDRLLIFSRRQLEHVLRTYTDHYNRHRPHRSLALRPPERASRSAIPLRAPLHPTAPLSLSLRRMTRRQTNDQTAPDGRPAPKEPLPSTANARRPAACSAASAPSGGVAVTDA